jgi:acyl-CoA reductase-like NAD-dependent aldehyde dehydrogenase
MDIQRILMDIAALLRQELPSWASLEAQQTGRPVREMKIQLARLPEWIEYHASLIRTAQGITTPLG